MVCIAFRHLLSRLLILLLSVQVTLCYMYGIIKPNTMNNNNANEEDGDNRGKNYHRNCHLYHQH